MVDQKSGPALAGPAAPATTALLSVNSVWLNHYFFKSKMTPIYSLFLHYQLVSSSQKINIGNTGNQNRPDLEGGSGYLYFQY